MASTKADSARVKTDDPASMPKTKGLVSISQAASILDVSIDTIRRWDKNGTLKSTRPDGKNRYFAVDDLEAIKFSQPLSISEVSEQLGISPSTLRRLEKKDLIKPDRNEAGERTYDRTALQKFLHSDYFLRQKEVELEILKPLSGKPEENSADSRLNGHRDPATHALLGEHHISIAQLKKFRKIFLISAGVLVGAFTIIIVVITLLFFLFPESTAKNLGYAKRDPLGKKFIFQPADSLLARQFKPFSHTALRVVEAVNPDLRQRIAPQAVIKDVNDIFKPDAEGNVKSIYTFTVPDTSYLKIPDQGLVQNLNSEFVQGRKPGCEKGNLAIVGVCAGTTNTTTPVGATTVVTTGNSDGGDITSVDAGVGLFGGGSDGAVRLRIELQPGSGMEATAAGLTLARTCASGQILKWSGSAWTCSIDNDASGGTPNLQTVYNASSNPEIILNSGNGALNIRDAASPLGGNLLEVQNNGGGTTYFAVSASGTSIASGLSYSGQGAVTISSGSGTTLLVDSGTTGNLNVGTSGYAKAITIGNNTGTTALTLIAGSGGLIVNANSIFNGGISIAGVANDITTGTNEDLTLDANGTGRTVLSDAVRFSTLTTDKGILYTDGSGNLAQTAQGPAGTVLHGNGTGAPTFSAVSLTADVSGLLPLANGGTNANLAASNGGIIYSNASSMAVLAGTSTANQCLLSGSNSAPSWGPCSSGSTSVKWSDLLAPTTSLSLPMNELTSSFTWDTANSAASFNGFTFAINNDASTDSNIQRVIQIQNNNFTGGGATEVLLKLDQADADSTLGSAIQVTNSGSTGFITNAVDASAVGIVNALNIGANRIFGTTGTIQLDNFSVNANGTVTIAAGQAYTGVNAVTLSSGGGNTLTLKSASTTGLTIDASNTALQATGLNTINTSTALSLNPNTGTSYALDTTATTLSLFGTPTTLNFAQGATSLNIASTGSLARTINIGTGTGADSINIGTGAAAADAIIFGNNSVATTLAFNSGVTTGTAYSQTSNSVTSGNSISVTSTGLTSGNALLINGGTALTTGSLLNLSGASYNPATSTGNLVNLSFTHAGNNASGTGTVVGVNVASTINTTGAGAKEIDGVNVAAPTVTACTTGSCTWNGLKVNTVTSGALSTLTNNGLLVNSAGVGAGVLNGVNISGITAGAGVETALNIGRGWDNAINIDPSVAGTIINASYASSATQTGALTGLLFDFSTNFSGAQSRAITAVDVAFPGLSVSGSVTNYTGFNIGSATNIFTNPGTINWNGASFTMPNITQTSGTITSNGLRVTTGSITTGGTQNGLLINAQGAGAGTLTGLNISAITAGAGSETGIKIGAGWDTALDLSAAMGTAALSVGANTISGTTAVIDFSNFDVSGTGNVTLQSANGLDCNTASCEVRLGHDNATTIVVGGITSTARTINIGTGTGADAINIGTGGTGADNIAIGSTANNWNITSAGTLTLGKAGTTQGGLTLAGTGSNGSTTIKMSNSGTASINWVLPSVQGGVSTFLANDGSGNLSWSTSATPISGLNAASGTNTINNTNLAQTWNWNAVTTETALTIGSAAAPSGITTGSLLAIGDSNTKFVHTTSETGSLQKITFSDQSTAASGTSISNGLQVSSTVNTSGAGIKQINAISVATPTLTACVSGACTWDGYEVNTQANTNSLITQNGLSLSSAGQSTAGVLNGINIGSITAGGATESGIIFGSGWDTNITTTATTALLIESGTTGTITIGGDASAEALNFGTGAADKDLTIGSLTTGSSLLLQSDTGNITINPDAGDLIGLNLDNVAAATGVVNVCQVSTGGEIGVSASATSCAVSSRRYKHSIEDLGDKSSLEVVNALRPVSFTYNWGEDSVGFIAEEVEQIDNRLVFYNGDGIVEGVDYEFITAYLAGAIHEVNKKVDTNVALASGGLQALTDRVNSLESRVASIEANQNTTTTTSGNTVTLSGGQKFEIRDASGAVLAAVDTSGNTNINGNVGAKNVIAGQVVGTDIGQRVFVTDTSINIGTVVSIDTSIANGAKRSATAYDNRLLGVVTGAPSMVVDASSTVGEERTVAISGVVAVKVNNQNGSIKAGDTITSSDIPGEGMKATRPGAIIGYAVSDFSSSSGTVLVKIGSGYQSGDVVSQIDNLNSKVASLEADVTNLKDQANSNASSQIDLSNLQVGTMTVDLDLIVSGAMVVEGPATFKEAVRFQKDVTIDGNVAVNGTATFNNDSAGLAKIQAGGQVVKIQFSKPYSSVPVVTVSLGDGKFATYSYRNVTESGFEIILKDQATEELTFSWTVTSVNGVKTVIQEAP